MALPYFFVKNLSLKSIMLDEDTSRHVISVLRMKKGDEMVLTDGMGKKAVAVIEDDNRKKTAVILAGHTIEPQRTDKVIIGISLIKNSSRFEWFLEKATEIGISEIIPLICERTVREKFRYDRMKGILVSSMLQSQQTWLPLLHEPCEFDQVLSFSGNQKLIAHCSEDNKQTLHNFRNTNNDAAPMNRTSLILIGPEGDFTPEETASALEHQFIPVSLGSTRLRTETAGIVAATLLCI